MPGLVIFKRRWSIGSDDLIIPAAVLLIAHLIWIIFLSIILSVIDFRTDHACTHSLAQHTYAYLAILVCCISLEAAIMFISMRGSILNPEPRSFMHHLLYFRLTFFVLELIWMALGVSWLVMKYQICPQNVAKKVMTSVVAINSILLVCVFLFVWCTFDSAGKFWVKFRRYQLSTMTRKSRIERRSGTNHRNWRQRKSRRAYEQSWDRRCNVLFCCVREDRHQSSFTEISQLFTEFFRELDVVPTDVIAGFVLLRTRQRDRCKAIVNQASNPVYQYLSGVAVTSDTKFLHLQDSAELQIYECVAYYMKFALAAYGWPIYLKINPGKVCSVLCNFGCCRHTSARENSLSRNEIVITKLCPVTLADIVYSTYHDDIGETPFFVALDRKYKKVVIAIRGTLSMKDVLTDLKADSDYIPVDPLRREWVGHKGMVQAASYIKQQLLDLAVLAKAFAVDSETSSYEIVCVGHSLGAGTAAILTILLQQQFPSIHCYSFSPPGGLLSAACVNDTKHFITSVVVGKDIVPRIGLHQLELLRQALIEVIKESSAPKWHIIGSSCCCPCVSSQDNSEGKIVESKDQLKTFAHPTNSEILLTQHVALFPPGRIIHVVRNHRNKKRGRWCHSTEPIFQGIWVDNKDFREVLISPKMIKDHMPENVSGALDKVLVSSGPSKPCRGGAEEPDTAGSAQNLHETASLLDEPNGSRPGSLDHSLSWDYSSSPLVTHHQQQPQQQQLMGASDQKTCPLAASESLTSECSNAESSAGLRKLLHGEAGSLQLGSILQSPSRAAVCVVPRKMEAIDDSCAGHMPLAHSTPIKLPDAAGAAGDVDCLGEESSAEFIIASSKLGNDHSKSVCVDPQVLGPETGCHCHRALAPEVLV